MRAQASRPIAPQIRQPVDISQSPSSAQLAVREHLDQADLLGQGQSGGMYLLQAGQYYDARRH